LVSHRRIQGRAYAIYRVEYLRNYCIQCEWEATTEEHSSRREVSELAIKHHYERGHDIDSLVIEYPALNT
jgi:hypothetical protein